MDSPLGQSFIIERNDTEGVFLTKLVLYFSSKDANLPVSVEIRTVENGIITNKKIPYSRVTLQPNSINIPNEATPNVPVGTPFIFETPIYLKTNQEYAFVIIPAAANPNYNVFISRIGETDVVTGESITKQPYSGVLFVSSNDRTYTEIQQEDIKFDLYVAKFTSNTGTFSITNENMEYISWDELSGNFYTDEPVIGSHKVTMSITSGVVRVNDILYTSNTKSGKIVSWANSNATHYVCSVSMFGNTQFSNGDVLSISSNTGSSFIVTNVIVPTAKVHYFDRNNPQKMILVESTGNFDPYDEIFGTLSGSTCRIGFADGRDIYAFKSLPYDTNQSYFSHLKFGQTDLSWNVRTLPITAQNSSGFDTLTATEINKNINQRNRKIVHSRYFEVKNFNSEKSFKLNGSMNTTNPFLSAAVDMNRNQNILVSNIVNNTTEGETNARGGFANFKYITRKVTLNEGQDAEDLKVFVAGYIPQESDIKVYCKLLHREDSDVFEDRNWIEMVKSESSQNALSSSENREDFLELEYNISETDLNNGIFTYTNSQNVTFSSYKYYAIKIVCITTNKANPPRIKDLRAIALQK